MNDSFLPPANNLSDSGNQTASILSSLQKKSRLKELQDQLLIKRLEILLMQAEAGEISSRHLFRPRLARG